MTLQPYTPERLDELALRFLDLSSDVRELAQTARREGIGQVPVHDKKALQWLSLLEEWIGKSKADLAVVALRQQAARRAEEAAARLT